MIFCYCKVGCITKYDNFYYKAKQVYHKVGSFYDKVVQVLESRKYLLQIGAGITNWGNYYKVGGK